MDNENKVVSFGNRVFFYGEVNAESTIALFEEFHKLREHDKIYLHINSQGGNGQLGLTLADEISLMADKVIAVADGWVASAAILMYLAAGKRLMRHGSQLLVHSISGETEGSYASMQDDMIMYRNLERSVIKIIKDHSNVEEDKIKELMDRESWMDYLTAYSYGFVDGFYEG